MTDILSAKERAILLSLLLHGPILSNSKKEAFRLHVAASERKRLNALGLVVSVRKAAYEHRLTDAGRRWCLSELASGSARAGDSPLERTLYSLLVALRGTVDLPAMFSFRPLGGEKLEEKHVELAVRAAYKELRGEPGGGVRLADLFNGLHSVLNKDFGAALS